MARLISHLLILSLLLQPFEVAVSPARAAHADPEGHAECAGFFARVLGVASREKSFETLKSLNAKGVQDFFPKNEAFSPGAVKDFQKEFDQLLELRTRFENFPASKVRDYLRAKTGNPYPSLDALTIQEVYQKDKITLRELQDFALLNAVEDSIVTKKELTEALSGRSASEIVSLASRYGKKLARGFWDKTWGFVTFSAVTTMIIPFWTVVSAPVSNYLKRITPEYEKAKQTRIELSLLTQKLQTDDFKTATNIPDSSNEEIAHWSTYESQYLALYDKLRKQLSPQATADSRSPESTAKSDTVFMLALSALNAEERGTATTAAYGVPTELEKRKIALLADWKLATLTNPDLMIKNSIGSELLANDLDHLAQRGLFKLFVKELTARIAASVSEE